MSIQIDPLLAAKACCVVFVKDSATARALEEEILQREPDFRTEIHSAFHFQKKIGPFRVKNKDSVWKILSRTPKAKAEGAAYLQQQMRDMDINYIDGRRPATLSHTQRERCSVLYEALCGRNRFLLKEQDLPVKGEDFAHGYSHFMTVAKWMNGYGEFPRSDFDFIWITKMTKEALMEKMSEKEINFSPFSFFEMKGDAVVSINKKAWLSSSLSYIPELEQLAEEGQYGKMTVEQKFLEGKKYDRFSGYGAADGSGDEKKAFLWYAAAAIEGHLEAMAILGKAYFRGYGVCAMDEERGLYWTAKAAFHPKANSGYPDKKTERILRWASDVLMDFYKEKPDSKEILLRYGGDAAEELIELADMLREGADVKPVINKNTFTKL